MKPLILIVEDEEETSEMLRLLLKRDGFDSQAARNAFQAEGMLSRLKPDLLILDRQLPDSDGLDFCRTMRARDGTKDLPVLFLTGKKSVPDRVAGLSVGGDDYLAKPFSPEELLARVRALLRRSRRSDAAPSRLESGGLSMDLDARKALYKGKELPLSRMEFNLLQAFLENRDRVLERRFLLSRVWGYEKELELSTRVVDVTVSHLREKLGRAGERITAVPGYGYRFEGPE